MLDPDRLARAVSEQYRIEREIGAGGMATVYLARDLKHDRDVALKVLRPDISAALGRERFLREIRIAARLDHPRILTLIDSGERDGILWYAVPYVRGESLRAKLDREHQLPIDEALDITRQIAAALDYAHESGVLHRDIKPENILLHEGEAMLADFGIALAAQDPDVGRMTGTGISLGTPLYMSPEQAAADRTLDARSEVYSLAAVLYEMLAGEPPITAANSQALVSKLLSEPPVRLRVVRDAVPAVVDSVVARALAKTPADRFNTPGEFARALGSSVGEEGKQSPEAAESSSGLARLRRAAIAAAILLVAAAAGYVAWRGTSQSPGNSTRPRTLAVLPFKHIGGEGDSYFADALAEEITSRLAGLSGLAVISRTSADQYSGSTKQLPEIAQELGADYILEGSVIWERSNLGERIRVTPRLVRASEDTPIWAEPVEATAGDLLALQARIAERVAVALDIAVQEPERRKLISVPTSSLDAYRAYQLGNALVNSAGDAQRLSDALHAYERAVAIDSGFSHAFAGMAHAHASAYASLVDRRSERLEAATRAAHRALRLAPELPEAHFAKGLVHLLSNQRDSALQALRRANALSPNNSSTAILLASIEQSLGDWNTAAARLERTAGLDPRSAAPNVAAATAYMYVRDEPRATRFAERAARLEPSLDAQLRLAEIAMNLRGDTLAARQIMRGAIDRFGLPAVLVSNSWVLVLLDSADLRAGVRLQGATLGTPAMVHLQRASLHAMRADSASARAHADSARTLLLRTVARDSLDAHAAMLLAFSAAYGGRQSEARREAERALRLMPYSSDAWQHADLSFLAAEVMTLAGDHDRAIALLGRLLTIPSVAARPGIRVDPRWRALRGDQRFRVLTG